MFGIGTDPGRGPAREVLRKPGKGGKRTGEPLTFRTVLPGLIGLKVTLVHGTEITKIDTKEREVAL